MSTTQPVNDTRAPRSTPAGRMAASRARQRCGSMLVRVEVLRTVIDGLVSAGVLSEAERTDRAAIQRAVTDVLNALAVPNVGFSQVALPASAAPAAMAPQPAVPRTLARISQLAPIRKKFALDRHPKKRR
jgi:hypothetical protein